MDQARVNKAFVGFAPSFKHIVNAGSATDAAPCIIDRVPSPLTTATLEESDNARPMDIHLSQSLDSN